MAAWKKTLFNQFHDILPGSCIERAVDEARALYAEALTESEAVAQEAMCSLADAGRPDGNVRNTNIGMVAAERAVVAEEEGTRGEAMAAVSLFSCDAANVILETVSLAAAGPGRDRPGILSKTAAMPEPDF